MKSPKFDQKQILKHLRKFSTVKSLQNALGVSELTARKYVKQLAPMLETKTAELPEGTKGRPATLYRVRPAPKAVGNQITPEQLAANPELATAA